jgi:predicted FMN-binding regulatory protein PaiB
MPQPSIREAIALARRIAFASVITGGESGPTAAHVPVYVDEKDDRLDLRSTLLRRIQLSVS